jgi:hypothetical protein
MAIGHHLTWYGVAKMTFCNYCIDGNFPLQTQLEVRDGIGGGFNERQERVAQSSVEVGEDGFDDFGRRVQSRVRGNSDKEQAALARLKQSYGLLFQGSSEDPDDKADGERNAERISGQFDDAMMSGSNFNSNRRDDNGKNTDNESRSERRQDNKYAYKERDRERPRDSDKRRDSRDRYDKEDRRGNNKDGYNNRDNGDRERDRNDRRGQNDRPRDRSRDRRDSRRY